MGIKRRLEGKREVVVEEEELMMEIGEKKRKE